MAGKKSAKPHKAPRKLTPKQERFAAEYLVDLNATRAATAAGYSAKSAEHIGYQLLQNPLVQEAIAAGQRKLAQRTEITQERVIAEIARIAFSDPQDAFDAAGNLLKIREMPEHIRRALSSIKVKRFLGSEHAGPEDTTEIKFWSKDAALEKLCKHLGLFAEETVNLNLRGKGPAAAIHDLTDEELRAIAAQGLPKT